MIFVQNPVAIPFNLPAMWALWKFPTPMWRIPALSWDRSYLGTDTVYFCSCWSCGCGEEAQDDEEAEPSVAAVDDDSFITVGAVTLGGCATNMVVFGLGFGSRERERMKAVASDRHPSFELQSYEQVIGSAREVPKRRQAMSAPFVREVGFL